MPVMFKVASLMETTRPTAEGVGKVGEGVSGKFIPCLRQAVTPSFCSSSVPAVLQCFIPISTI